MFSEKPLGQNVDYWLTHLSAGYWFKADLSVNMFLSLKYGYGISLLSARFIDDEATFPPVYPDDYDTREWWHHDRLVGNRNLVYGLGINYALDRKWSLSASTFRSVWTDEANEEDFALTLGVTRFFGGESL